MPEMRTLDDIDLEGENVILRTDLNLPVEDGEPRKTVRFERYLKTVKELSNRGARTLVVAHQGRPARDDFLSLEEHAELMGSELDQEVQLVRTFFGSELGDAVASMGDGEVKLLENIRFLSEELQNMPPERHANDFFVKNISKYFDVFVNDAFSAAHRSHGSLVGFNSKMASVAGPVMVNEVEGCDQVIEKADSPVLVLGGEKPSDIVGMLEHMVEKADRILLGGIPAELALMIKDYRLGEKADWIEEHGYDSDKEKLEALMGEHSDKFVIPEDVSADSGDYQPGDVPEDEMVWDIGPKTAQKYAEIISKADSVVMKGPMGAFEDYPNGTKTVVTAIAESTGYTVLGGGHTSSLVQRFGHDLDEFSHVSIAGGAFVRYMSGEELAAIKALEK